MRYAGPRPKPARVRIDQGDGAGGNTRRARSCQEFSSARLAHARPLQMLTSCRVAPPRVRSAPPGIRGPGRSGFLRPSPAPWRPDASARRDSDEAVAASTAASAAMLRAGSVDEAPHRRGAGVDRPAPRQQETRRTTGAGTSVHRTAVVARSIADGRERPRSHGSFCQWPARVAPRGPRPPRRPGGRAVSGVGKAYASEQRRLGSADHGHRREFFHPGERHAERRTTTAPRHDRAFTPGPPRLGSGGISAGSWR